MAELTPSVMGGAETLLLTCDRCIGLTDGATGRLIVTMYFRGTEHVLFINEWSRRALRDQGFKTRGELKDQEIALVRVTNRNPRTGGKVDKYQVADPPEWREIVDLQTEAESADDPRQRPREVPAPHHRADG